MFDNISVKQLEHLFQLVISERFQMFDYQSKNYEIYGTQLPLAYNLSTVDIPIVVMGATNDYLVSPPVRCL